MTPYEQATLYAALVFGVVGAVTGVWGLHIAKRTAGRATERDDVRWKHTWEFPGICVVTNVGSSTAHHVTASIVADGALPDVNRRAVGPNQSIRVEVPWLAKFAREWKTDPIFGNAESNFPVETEIVMVWQTKLGTPHQVRVEPAPGMTV